MMVKQMEAYQKGLTTLKTMHESLWELFELIDASDKSEEFCNSFHRYWDHIEEIIAVEKINKYLDEINNLIIPNFKKKVLKYID